MSGKAKILILVAALLLTFLIFNIITCSGSYCQLFKSGQEWSQLAAAGCLGPPDVVVTALAKT
ncbi:MAG: hypothetical protein OEW18_06205 [Candidatus Aminicenantes bacterium]|nr:hypothetical protein [Candidatus Aminicenantes bacterium]